MKETKEMTEWYKTFKSNDFIDKRKARGYTYFAMKNVEFIETDEEGNMVIGLSDELLPYKFRSSVVVTFEGWKIKVG